MRKKIIKIFAIICIVVSMICICSNVFAANTPTTPTDTNIPTETFNNSKQTMIGWIRAVGIIISVVIIMAICIKYIVDKILKKDANKKVMLLCLIFAVLLFIVLNIGAVKMSD